MRPIFLILAAASAAISSVPSAASVVFVNQNISGTVHNGASWSTAFTTLAQCVAAARNGDEVWVAKGTYVGTTSFQMTLALYGGFSGKETLRQQRDWKLNPTVLDGGGSVLAVLTIGNNTVVDGFTIRNGNDGVYTNGSPALANDTISGNTRYGLNAYLGTVSVLACTISGNGTGVYAGFGSTTLANNTIACNNSNGVYVEAAGTANLVNNTISGNGGDGVHVAYSGAAVLVNNILAFNGGCGIQDADGGIVSAFSHCDTFGNAVADYSGYSPIPGQGNISTDPKLAHVYHDIHIQPNSPCRDAGDKDAIIGVTDIDRQPRTQGASVDIGSDESDGTAWVVPTITWHVSPTGNDAGNGLTWQSAKQTITAALLAAQATDEVWVAKGTYHEVLRPGAKVALYGGFAGTESLRDQRDWKANPTELDSSKSDVVTCHFRDTVLDGFIVRNGETGVYISSVSTLVNNTLANNIHGVYVDFGTAKLADCCLCDNANGMYIAGGTATISRSVLFGNFDAVQVHYGTVTLMNSTLSGNANGLFMDNGSANSVNCTICGNGIDGVHVGAYATATLTNNILAFNGAYGLFNADGGAVMTFSHNCTYGNGKGNCAGYTPPNGQGNCSLDPLLTNPYHNTHLQPRSPCIDAGSDGPVQLGWTDIYGKTRILGAHVDIGSDESDGTQWAIPPRTWYVSTLGNDGADGASWQSAKKTVGAALLVAQGTDEVWVAKGVYSESVRPEAGVAIYGGFTGSETKRQQRDWKANPTVIDGCGSTHHVVTSQFRSIVIDGFTLRNGASGVFVNAGTATLANNTISGNLSGVGVDLCCTVLLTDNTISGNSGDGAFVDGVVTLNNNTIGPNGGCGVYSDEENPLTLTGNTITGNAQDGVYDVGAPIALTDNVISGNGYGVDVFAARVSLSRNTITGNDVVGVYGLGGTFTATDNIISGNGYGLFLGGDCTMTLYNNTIAGNRLDGVYVYHYVANEVYYRGTANLVNDILAFNGGCGVYNNEGTIATFTHNDVYGNAAGPFSGYAPPAGNGNLLADPLFVDRTHSVFGLITGSPCIETGDDSVVTLAETDRDGGARVIGHHVDMGAVESTTPFPPFTMPDVVTALEIASGSVASSQVDVSRLNFDLNKARIDICDAARIARKVAGLDANP